MGSEKIYLSEKQYEIVKIVAEIGKLSVRELAQKMNIRPEDLMRDLAELENIGLIRLERQAVQIPVLTSEGKEALEKGLPEERVFSVANKCIEKPVNDFIRCVAEKLGVEFSLARIGFQHLVRHRCIKIEKGIVVLGDEPVCHKALEEAAKLKTLLRKVIDEEPISNAEVKLLKRRKMLDYEKRTIIYIVPAENLKQLLIEGKIEGKTLLTVVPPIVAPKLDKYIVKEFDLSIPPPIPTGGRFNAYIEFLDLVRDILVSMGFEEVKGPHVELEFWNFDALFQAQDHPAREIHDTFFLKSDFKGKVSKDLLHRAAKVHKKGWGYEWNPLRALRPILRSQTTAVTVRSIFERGEGEYRVFTLDRVFRPETLDAKHAMEFYQLDGIIVGKNVNFKHLLAFFKEFAVALGVKKVWFKPGYFPFTEPSVEGFIKHPKLGWIEVFPGGVFRPEVMEILGAPGVKAIAWGIGIDRLAMSVLGLDDIRDLFSKDIGFLQKLPIPMLPYFTRKTSCREVEVVPVPL